MWVGRYFTKLLTTELFYGYIAFGSATRHLPGRAVIGDLKNGVNNIFYHIEKVEGKYPKRNFTTFSLLEAEKKVIIDYPKKYSDNVHWFETLVELPRTGDLYKKAGYDLVGQTKGFTCKRTAGQGTDSWTGQRVWDTVNLRPKLVFVKRVERFDSVLAPTSEKATQMN